MELEGPESAEFEEIEARGLPPCAAPVGLRLGHTMPAERRAYEISF